MFRDLMTAMSLMSPEEVRRNPPPGMPKALVEDMLRLVEREKSRSKGGSNPPMPNDSRKR
jgi:hypothetical protein